MAKVKSTAKTDPKRSNRAIKAATAPEAPGDFYHSSEKSSPKEIKKYTSNGALSKIGKTFKSFLGK